MKIVTEVTELTSVLPAFDFENPQFDIIEQGKAMYDFMVNKGGIGLAANQVGLQARVMTIRGIGLITNPTIVDKSDTEELLEEGCLSFVGLYVKVKRPNSIRLRYKNEYGETFTKVFKGLTARAILHEIDHLDGILFYNRASRYHRDLGFKHRKKEMLGVADAVAKFVV